MRENTPIISRKDAEARRRGEIAVMPLPVLRLCAPASLRELNIALSETNPQ